MTYIKTLSTIAILGSLMLTPAAFAGELNKSPEKTKSVMIKTENTQALAAVAIANKIPVQTEDGKVYYNRYVSDAEITNVSTDINTVDTYTFEYQGRTYTNKIVSE